jgi:hypothetical protein
VRPARIPNVGVKLDLITSLYDNDVAAMKRSISETIANMTFKVDPYVEWMQQDFVEYLACKRTACQQRQEAINKWADEHRRFGEREYRSGAAREKVTYEAFVEDMNREIATFKLEQMAKAGQESGMSIDSHGDNDRGHGVNSGGPLLEIIDRIREVSFLV